jgi:hypothetical protein
MINKLSRNPPCYLSYFPPEPSRLSQPLTPTRLFKQHLTF